MLGSAWGPTPEPTPGGGGRRRFLRQQLSEQAVHMNVAFAAFAGGGVKLQIRVALADLTNMLECAGGQRGSPEIGMQDDSGCID